MLNMHAQIVPNMLGKSKASLCGTSLLWSSEDCPRLKAELAGLEVQSLLSVQWKLWVTPGCSLAPAAPLSSASNAQSTAVPERKDLQLNLFCQHKPSHKQILNSRFQVLS